MTDTPSVRPLEPRLRLAWALRSGPGNYAVLLGAGVSRGAGVLTAWEVLSTLVQRAQVVAEPSSSLAPIQWWAETFGREPTYPAVLAAVGASIAERRAILAEFFERDGDDDTQRIQPSLAHQSVAELVAEGSVRIILTTNFDRLMEEALRDVGVEPVSVSSPSAAEEMAPLHSHRCFVVHLHGDYLSLDVLNTEEELASYDQRMERIIRQVLDDYGLVYVGWSAEWDTALRDAVDGCARKPFASWWIEPAPPNPTQIHLMMRRSAELIDSTADAGLAAVVEACRAIAEIQARADPLTTAAAVAAAKRELASGGQPIRVHDRLHAAMAGLAESPMITDSTYEGDAREVRRRTDGLLEDADLALMLVAIVTYWGDEMSDPWWFDDIERFAHRRHVGGNSQLIALTRAPALLVMYSAGVAATASERWDLVGRLLLRPRAENYGGLEMRPVAEVLYPGMAGLLGAEEIFRYLAPRLVQHLGLDLARVVDAWERFCYLHHLTHQNHSTGDLGWEPYIRAEGIGPNEGKPTPELWLESLSPNFRRFEWLENAGPCVTKFRVAFTRWTKGKDLDLLAPARAGMLPSGRHYPGRYDDRPLPGL